jgi:hypothetical protein
MVPAHSLWSGSGGARARLGGGTADGRGMRALRGWLRTCVVGRTRMGCVAAGRSRRARASGHGRRRKQRTPGLISAHPRHTPPFPARPRGKGGRLTRQAKISPNTCASISCVAVTQLESRLLCATRGGARAHAGRHQAGRGLSPVLSLPRAALCPTQCAKVNAVSRKRSFEVLW